MAEFLKAFGLGGRGEEKEVVQTLKRLDKSKTPLLMEIEQSQIHFRSVLAVKQGVIAVAKPMGLGAHLKKDSVVRFSVPDEPGHDIRLQVASPHFNLTSGNAIFICNFPTSFSEGTKRRATRFNTSRFNNLLLSVPTLKYRFRIVDLSMNGVKIHVQGNVEQMFPLGQPISPANIAISKYSVELGVVIPRVHKGNTVGCEMAVPEGSSTAKYLVHLINSLQKSEEKNLQTAEL